MNIQYIIKEVDTKEKTRQEDKQKDIDKIMAYYNNIAYYTTTVTKED
jgi:hypothetical protein